MNPYYFPQQGQGHDSRFPPQQYQPGEQQQHGRGSVAFSPDHVYHQQFQQHQQYQQYLQLQQQQQQQNPLHVRAATSSPAAALPPSYTTPLPPPKSKQMAGARKAQPVSSMNQSQYQAQYQVSMQMGAAAASAATAALLQFGYPSTVGASALSTEAAASGGDPSPQPDWFSTYETPTLQQRMAATTAMNAPPPQRASHGNSNGRRNNNNSPYPQHQQQQKNSWSNKGKQQQHKKPDHTKEPAGNTDAATAKESAGFHCDACDVTFHKEDKLMAHIAAHRSCPDCQYSASPSLVTDHRKLIHGSKDGPAEPPASSPAPSIAAAKAAAASVISTTASAVAKLGSRPARNQGPKSSVNHELLHPLTPTLNTPEEIAAWIAQRRKAWPTEANILKKAQERQDMIAKGQVIEDSSNKGFNGKEKRRMNDNDRRSNSKRGYQSTTVLEVEGIHAKKAKVEDGSTAISVDGLVAYASSNEPSDNEDADESMDPVKDAITSKDPSIMGKLALPKERSARPKRPCKYFLRGNCTRGDKCIFSHDPSLTNKVQKTRVSPKKEVFRSRPSLLQMLLSGEIKQEKNKLLEAIRYIVDNNFFEKREPSGILVEELA